MAAGGNPNRVKLGPGRLHYAPLGTAEPASATAVLPSAWRPVGYTEDGTEVTTNITSEDILVAEEFDPIDNVMTARSSVVNVTMAEARKSNLMLALGGDGTTADDGNGFAFPDAATIPGVMLIWDSDLADTPTASNRRWIFRKVKPSGNVSVVRRKAPAKNSISASLTAVKPDATLDAVWVFPNANGEI
jgi:hypothetical protein